MAMISCLSLSSDGQIDLQLVRPPFDSNSEVTDELLLIRLMASPNNPATESVVIFTPGSQGGRLYQL